MERTATAPNFAVYMEGAFLKCNNEAVRNACPYFIKKLAMLYVRQCPWGQGISKIRTPSAPPREGPYFSNAPLLGCQSTQKGPSFPSSPQKYLLLHSEFGYDFHTFKVFIKRHFTRNSV
jgi:hypothetical protein